MNKKITALLLSVLLSLCMVIPVFAESDRMLDYVGVLSQDENEELAEKLDQISEAHDCDVIVLIVDGLEGQTATAYADDFFDNYGYGMGDNGDGILFLLSMEERDWAISTHGFGITAITDAGQEYIMDQVLTYFSDDYYALGLEELADYCDQFLTQAETGEPYDIDNLPQEPFSPLFSLFIALVIGVIIALIATLIMKAKLKSVHSQAAAGNYVKADSFHVSTSRDSFLYRTVTRTAKPKESESGGSSTHTSSSGQTHGGSSGKF